MPLLNTSRYGPIALIDEEMPVVALAPDDAMFEKMVGNIQEAKARGGSVIAVTTEGHEDIKQLLDPARRGCDVDQPRNLAKSVTVE